MYKAFRRVVFTYASPRWFPFSQHYQVGTPLLSAPLCTTSCFSSFQLFLSSLRRLCPHPARVSLTHFVLYSYERTHCPSYSRSGLVRHKVFFGSAIETLHPLTHSCFPFPEEGHSCLISLYSLDPAFSVKLALRLHAPALTLLFLV